MSNARNIANLPNGDDTSSIVQKKQQLRDITNAVDSCTTVEELKAIECE